MNGFGAHLGTNIDASSRLPPPSALRLIFYQFWCSFWLHFGSFRSLLAPFCAPMDPFWHPLAPLGQAFSSNRPTLDALWATFAHFWYDLASFW